MNDHPAFMSIQIAWMRLVDEPPGGCSDAGRTIATDAIRPADIGLGVLPLFHIFGLNAVLNLALFAGASVVLVERFDPVSALDVVRERGVTIVDRPEPIDRRRPRLADEVGAGLDQIAVQREPAHERAVDGEQDVHEGNRPNPAEALTSDLRP